MPHRPDPCPVFEPSASPCRPRRGLTFIEVLVVLVIIGIAGALVLSRQVLRGDIPREASPFEMKAVVDSARRLAVGRQQPVRLRVYADGLWSVLAPDVAEPIAAGNMTEPPTPIDVTVDQRGTCRPTAGWVPRNELRAAFDAGKCRWVSAAAPSAMGRGR